LNQEDLDSNFKLENLEGCTVTMNGTSKMLFLRNIKNCTLNLAPAENSIMIHNCTNSNVNMIAQQIRIHDSYDVVFGVYTISKLIIEGSQRVKFRPYECDEWRMKSVKMYGLKNLWQEVQDFNWIKQEQSPNFELIQS